MLRRILLTVVCVALGGCSIREWMFVIPARNARNRRIAKLDSTPEDRWDARIAGRVREGKICLGMTRAAVLLSWGRPERKNKSVSVHGSREQWVYGGTYVYFVKGVVTSWQTRGR